MYITDKYTVMSITLVPYHQGTLLVLILQVFPGLLYYQEDQWDVVYHLYNNNHFLTVSSLNPIEGDLIAAALLEYY